MPKSYDQELLERKCVLLMKLYDTSLFDVEHVFMTCVSLNKDPGGPWWEIRCHTANRRNVLLMKGPSAPGRTRFKALRLLYKKLLQMLHSDN